MKTTEKDGKLMIALEGRIDTNNALDIENAILAELEAHNGAEPVFDAECLDYISSAGLRVLMKIRKLCGKPVAVENVSREVFEIFETTGFTELLDVKKALRRISVDGCEFIGQGAYGKVYRIDSETIAKIYRPEVTPEFVEKERNISQKAFLLGVPTAISYDVVKCDDSYGVVYELLNAQTVGNIMMNDRDKVTGMAERCASLLKELHDIEVEENGILPARKQIFLDWLENISEFLTDEETEKLNSFINSIPDRKCFLHGDFHAKNIMIQNEEFVLIDIGDAAYGHPIFDIATQITAYVCMPSSPNRPKEEIEKYLGFHAEDVGKYWSAFCCKYFGVGPDRVGEITQKYMPYAMLLMGFHSSMISGNNRDVLKQRVDMLVKGKLLPMLDNVQLLEF